MASDKEAKVGGVREAFQLVFGQATVRYGEQGVSQISIVLYNKNSFSQYIIYLKST